MSHEMNSWIPLTAILIALALSANSQKVTAESPPHLVGVAGKAPVTKDEDDDGKWGSKNNESRTPSPAPTDKDQVKAKENDSKENELARPSPNGSKNNEQQEKKKEENVTEPNE